MMGNHEKQFLFVMGGLMTCMMVVGAAASIAAGEWTPIVGFGIAIGVCAVVLTLVFGLDTIARKIWKDDK